MAVLADEGVCVECHLDGVPSCVCIDLPEQGIKILRDQTCADYALLLPHDANGFEAHVFELTETVSLRKWHHVKQQLESAVLHVLAIAGILGIEIHGVVAYTAYNDEKLSRGGSTDPSVVRDTRWAEARRSWEGARLPMNVFARDVEHRRVPRSGDAPAMLRSRRRAGPGDTEWIFEEAAAVTG